MVWWFNQRMWCYLEWYMELQTSVNVIDFVTIASTGNAVDFGDLTAYRRFSSFLQYQLVDFTGGGYKHSSPSPDESSDY